VADPVRVERLAPNYSGWFAGVPVQTNSFGLRDTREDGLLKGRSSKNGNVFSSSDPWRT
jgi:hypothetical protein